MVDQKLWWQSRTIWTGIIGTIFAILAGFDMVPEGLSSEYLVETILGVTSVLAIVFRAKATASISTV